MSEYSVEWEIDVVADSPVKAAMFALKTLRDPDSLGLVFYIRDYEAHESYRVDLSRGSVTVDKL